MFLEYIFPLFGEQKRQRSSFLNIDLSPSLPCQHFIYLFIYLFTRESIINYVLVLSRVLCFVFCVLPANKAK